MFKLQKDMTHFKWEIGTYFSTNVGFKEAMKIYVVQFGWNLKFTNDTKRVRVRCKEDCEWEAYCAKLSNDES